MLFDTFVGTVIHGCSDPIGEEFLVQECKRPLLLWAVLFVEVGVSETRLFNWAWKESQVNLDMRMAQTDQSTD